MSYLVNMVSKSYNCVDYYVRKCFKSSGSEEPEKQQEIEPAPSSPYKSYENDIETDSNTQRNRDQRNGLYFIDSQKDVLKNLKTYFMERSMAHDNDPEISVDQLLIRSDTSRDEMVSRENSIQRSPETTQIDHRARIEDEVPRTDVVVVHNSEPLSLYENERIDLHRITNNNQLSAAEENALMTDYFENAHGKTSNTQLANLAHLLKTALEYKELTYEDTLEMQCTFGLYTVSKTNASRSTIQLLMITILKHVCGVLPLSQSELDKIQYTYNSQSTSVPASKDENIISTRLQDSEDTSDESIEENSTNQIETDTVSLFEKVVYKMKQKMILMEQRITYLTEENVRYKENLQVHTLRDKKEIEKLTIENKSLIENNSALIIQIETLKQKLSELDSNDTNEMVDCDLAMLQRRVHQLNVQKYNLIETDSMQREIDNLKIKLIKTNDDVTALRAQLQNDDNQSTKEVYMAKIEKVLKKYDKQKIQIKNIEKNVTDNTAHLHRTDQTVNVLLMTGLSRVREGINVEQQSWTPPPQQPTDGYGVNSVVSPRTALTNSAQSPTNVSIPSPPPSPAFVRSDNVRKTSADTPSPPPPPPPPPVPVVPGAPRVYERIPITVDILQTVKLKPASERQLKTKVPTPPAQ